MASSLNVESPNVHYSDKHIEVDYQYQTTSVLAEGPAGYTVSKPHSKLFSMVKAVPGFPGSSRHYEWSEKIDNNLRG